MLAHTAHTPEHTYKYRHKIKMYIKKKYTVQNGGSAVNSTHCTITRTNICPCIPVTLDLRVAETGAQPRNREFQVQGKTLSQKDRQKVT